MTAALLQMPFDHIHDYVLSEWKTDKIKRYDCSDYAQ